PDHLQARLCPAPAGRRDPPALRGQGAADRGAQADAGGPRPGREALCRAPGEAVLRWPDRIHHRRAGHRRRSGKAPGGLACGGPGAMGGVRPMRGATDGAAAAPGTIRGDLSISKQNTLTHGSDGPESARREIALWFRAEELVDYAIDGESWVSGGS